MEYTTIDQIVRSALTANGEGSLHKYQWYLQFALEGAKDFYMDSSQSVKTIQLEMNDIKQVELPLDFVDWVKVGIVCGKSIKILGVCDSIPILTETDSCGNLKTYDNCNCGVNAIPVDYAYYGGYRFLNFTNEFGEILGGIYGIGGGYTDKSYFRVVPEQRVMQFSSEINNTLVYLEYITDGFDPKSETVISPYAEKALRYYIHWQVSMQKNGPSSADARGWEDQYYNEYRKARRRIFDLTPRMILELSRKHFVQSPKI